jgi:transposase
VPGDPLLRAIDRFVDLSDTRRHLAPFYSTTGRPSVAPELLIRMLIIGYCYGIRLERRLCEEVHLNLAYRWFCRLGVMGEVPDHSTFSKNRHAVSAIATFCAMCSRRCCTAASKRASSAVMALRSTAA